MLSILVIFTIIAGITHLLQSLWRNRRFLLAASRIPGPPGFPPLIGGIYQFYGKTDVELATALLDISQRYTSPVKFWLGPLLMVVVDRPEDLKIVLNSQHCLDKVDPYRFFRVDRGLFAAPKELWKRHRKVLMPAFGPKVVDGFLPTFAKTSRSLCRELERFLPAGEVNIQYQVEKCALKSICDPEAIQDHLETIIFAGSETTATTLATTLLMLAINRDVQEKVFQEISTVCPNPFEREFIDQGALSQLVYTEQVVKETMRLFPIGPIVARKATGDVQLTQVTVPAGANVTIPIYKLQRNPQYWGSDAEAFDPERFSPERTARRHPYCYIPFTAGLRNCVGIRYSWQLMKVALVHLLWRYRFSTELAMEDLQLKLSMVLRIENGSVLRIERR
ncbi:hypothetical protein pipiens_011932 [Culex pipiens pipiens]|uniref:Cytochrome P450 n=1 Tax=Culex pipiens pipiens TaxID=38569 RepID=A0ABD1D4F4_CULPP